MTVLHAYTPTSEGRITFGKNGGSFSRSLSPEAVADPVLAPRMEAHGWVSWPVGWPEDWRREWRRLRFCNGPEWRFTA